VAATVTGIALTQSTRITRDLLIGRKAPHAISQ
jgi:hypothetical protein